MAEEYIKKMEREGRAPATIKKANWFLELLEDIGKRPIALVTPHELLDALKRVERRGHHETALRLRAFGGRVFRYGFPTLRTDRNPADILRGALRVPRVKHHVAIVEPAKVGELFRAIEDYSGRPETVFALKLAPHVFLRPGELRQAKWSEIDFADKIWRVPAERMKMKQAHAVPSIAFLLQQLRMVGCRSEFLFPAVHTTQRSISENSLNVALRRLGYGHDEMTSHGFRALASTLLNESSLWHPDAIERALAHGETIMTEKREAPFAFEGLDRIFHEKARLGILTSLAGQPAGLGFTQLKQLCGLTDGNLSRHIQALEEAGLVSLTKGYEGKRPHTSCRLTQEGRARFGDYLTVLEKVLKDAARANATAKGGSRNSKEQAA